MAKLKIIWADGREQEYEISRSVTMIGRTKDNDLKLTDRGISRKQCKIEGSPGSYSIVDLDSRNGTMVNGNTVSTSQLRNGDSIVIGSIKMKFIEEDAESSGSENSDSGRKCPSCGAPMSDGDVLCIKCGTFLKKSTSFFSGSSGFGGNWLPWVLVVLVLGTLLVAGLIIFKNDNVSTGYDEQDVQERIIQLIRRLETPAGGTYGELFDSLNIAGSDMEWDVENRGPDVYRTVLNLPVNGSPERMVFTVDIQSGDAEARLDDEEFTFSEF